MTKPITPQSFAEAAHAGQTDKLGIPYTFHIAHVAKGASAFGEEAEAVGWLHDTVEDTSATLNEIERLFGQRIRNGVDAMTKRKGESYFDDYLPRLFDDELAPVVKYFDSRHNLGKTHLLELGETRSRLERKYTTVLSLIETRLPVFQNLGDVPNLFFDGTGWAEG